jgi:hypothetical protein
MSVQPADPPLSLTLAVITGVCINYCRVDSLPEAASATCHQ